VVNQCCRLRLLLGVLCLLTPSSNSITLADVAGEGLGGSGDVMTEDPIGQLVSAIEDAIKKKWSPADIETFVGVEALFNTHRNDREKLEFIKIFDVTPETVPDFRKCKDVVWWDSPQHRRFPGEVVGVHWTADGTAHVFYGNVVP
jgi:hypothetical protein